jgi:hypothetical protein
MSLKQTELGGGQRRVEIDSAGEATGQIAGQNFGSLVAEVTPGRPSPYTVTGTLLAASGTVVQFNSWGIGMQGDATHKVRLRGAVRYTTADPNLAAMNNMIAAVEAELDLKELMVKGAVCEWK